MNLSLTVWRHMILFLTLSFQGCPADCECFIPLGTLTVEPAALFLLGSNLTVYCHISECEWSYKITLELNGRNVIPSKRINCTTKMFYLPRVSVPRSSVVCKMRRNQLSALNVVNGKDLRAGLPPDKPVNVSCETTQHSDLIDCSWERGQETHIFTFYNVSLCRANGTQIHSDHTKNGDKVILPREILDENTKYLFVVTAYNHFGASQSDPYIFCIKDLVIPETPHIVQMDFGNSFASATLRWETSESSVRLRPQIRLRANNNSWELRDGAELSEGLMQVNNLRPLTGYELQIRTCGSTSGFKTTWTSRSRCSRWSPSLRKMSPGRGPSQQLYVWRILAGRTLNGLKKVTVLWKPLPPEDYSGDLLQYKVLLGNDHEEICAAASSQCSVQVPAEVQALSVVAVTSYGTSPPANVDLRHAGVSVPVLRALTPAAAGSSVLVSWAQTFGEELLHFVVEWDSVPAGELQWKKLGKDLRNTSVSGLTAGVRYNVSLYAVTTRGVSAPTSSLIYSKEEKPVSGPTLFVRLHESRRVLVQWDELPVDQQRGFITKYTIYLHTLDSSSTEHSEVVPGSGPGETWLDCPEGALVLQLTASNSAGEGPRGRRVSSQPAAPAVGLVIVVVFTVTIFIVIVVNLMCWSCVRKRIKEKCISWGPEWLVENLPKPGRSNAIRLLEDDRSETLFWPNYSDPPLSPILVVSSEERDEVYPIIHSEESQTGSGQAVAETALSVSDTRAMLAEHASYKPQIATLVPLEEEEVNNAEEDLRNDPANAEEDGRSDVLEGLLGGLLSNVDVDYSDSSQGLTLGSIDDLLWPKSVETNVLNTVFFQEMRGTKEDVGTNVLSLDLQQDCGITLDTDDPCLSQCLDETTQNDGYFPQVSCLSTQE
ncbi:interleukin-23 receptor [Kryptolebias marmoratus]|uniref:Interleukin 23 receptor n=1 Tax=Kryptolebias marmoratus TaxID=37003 RepID=A0A3Q2ZYJ8_KRYMA|nr:interleukin-23 receptor [Kryptolebias marmoratus]XP_017262325.1 interleukin-23 receptor [Kryptolebias marmoratus]XP_017262328.1 interleukin-23 receptor [Kryptolebias marmoratus]